MKTKIYMGLTTIGICCCLFTIIRKNKSSEITFTENKLYNTTLQNQNPYSIFGSDGILLTTEYERKREYKLDITNKDKTSSLTKLELDTQTGIATLFDKNGKILTQKQLDTKEKARWLSVDPLSEKYYDLSPYNYCGNNPIIYIDPNGKDIWEINDEGRIINRTKDETQDAFYIVAKDADGNYQRTFTTDAEGNKTYNSISFDYGTIESQRTTALNSTDTYDTYQVRGDGNGTKLFEFMSDNITGNSGIEFSQAMTGIAGDKGMNFVTTGHIKAKEPGMTELLKKQLLHGYTIRELNHSHPRGKTPSGNYKPKPKGDLGFKESINNYLKSKGMAIPSYNIYHVPTKKKIPF